MKILLITIFPPEIGGPSTQAVHLCNALQSEGHQPIVLAFDRRRYSVESSGGTLVYRIRWRQKSGIIGTLGEYIRFVFKLYAIIKRDSPTVIHSNSVGFYSIVVVLLSRAFHIPCTIKFASDLVWEVVNAKGVVVNTIQEAYEYGTRAKIVASLQRVTLRSFTLVWAASEYRRRTLIDTVGVDARRIRVIPNRIALPNQPQQPRQDDGAIHLVMGGRFVPHKRFEDALHAISQLTVEDVVLHLFGGGSEECERRLQSLGQQLGIADRLRTHGTISNEKLHVLLGSSDIYVSPSIEEGFAISLIEAMAFGLPIVAAKKGATPELVLDGHTGLLYEPGNVDELARVLRRLILDKLLRRRLAANALQHVRQYDIREAPGEYSTFFQAAIEGPSSYTDPQGKE